MRNIHVDHEAQEAVVKSERPRLDHRRAAILNDQPASGDYTAGNTGTVGRIGRAGLADFLVGQVKDDAWRKQAVSVTSRPGSGVPVTATAPSGVLAGSHRPRPPRMMGDSCRVRSCIVSTCIKAAPSMFVAESNRYHEALDWTGVKPYRRR